ncbi:MAG: cytochrome-c peroxidase [Chloroflexi bacterium]|nr:cytochrome-c peroxidase [Chloroflexota bacterium]
MGPGALSVYPSLTGLEREFPPLNLMTGNAITPEKVALGRLLFFDPMLSQENDIACATYHIPNLGFSDGLPRAIGAGGTGVGPDRSGGIMLACKSTTIMPTTTPSASSSTCCRS